MGHTTSWRPSKYRRRQNSHLSSLRVLDAGESQVTDAPAGVDAVNLQLGELKGCIEGLGADSNDDGVNGQRHALNHLLGKTIFTGDGQEDGDSEVSRWINTAYQYFGTNVD